MHDTIPAPATAGLHTAVMAAIASVPKQVQSHALAQVTAYTEQIDRAAADPNSSTVVAHLERAAYWACTAREYGATEGQISVARAEGHAVTTD